MTKVIPVQELVIHIEKKIQESIAKGIWLEGMASWIGDSGSGVVPMTQEDKENWITERGIQSKRGATMAFQDWIKQLSTEEIAECQEEIEDEEDDHPSSVVPRKYKQKYGAKANCGDVVATKMEDISPDYLPHLASVNDIDFNRWAHLNPGMRRMNLGNVLRNRAKNGDEIVWI